MRTFCRTSVLAAALLLIGAGETGAHEGPPFPLLTDRIVGPFSVSVWAEPHLGLGSIFVILDRTDGTAIPEGTTVEVGVAPVSGRLSEARYRAEPQANRRDGHFLAEVLFDEEELWDIRVTIAGPDGGGVLNAQVRATPPGTIGPIGLIWYALPFIAIAMIGFRVLLRWREPVLEPAHP